MNHQARLERLLKDPDSPAAARLFEAATHYVRARAKDYGPTQSGKDWRAFVLAALGKDG